jgi:hypothetical protein
MIKASSQKRQVMHHQQTAARRAEARSAELRTRLMLAGGAIITVVAVVLALVLIKAGSTSTPAPSPADGPAGAALATVVKDLTGVPASTLDAVGAGSLSRDGIGRVSTSGNGYLAPVSGSPLIGPQDLQGLTWSQIAAALSDPSSLLAKGVDGNANYLAAAICSLTGNQPASACTAAVRALEPRLR